jgi:hypothetical protein
MQLLLSFEMRFRVRAVVRMKRIALGRSQQLPGTEIKDSRCRDCFHYPRLSLNLVEV